MKIEEDDETIDHNQPKIEFRIPTLKKDESLKTNDKTYSIEESTPNVINQLADPQRPVPKVSEEAKDLLA